MKNKLILFLGFIIIVASCVSNTDIFEKKIEAAIKNDNNISETEWKSIVSYAVNKKADLITEIPEIYENNILVKEKLREFILIYSKEKKIDSLNFWDVYKNPLAVKLYLESSMSVWPYDHGDKRTLKSNAINMLQKLPNFQSDENIMYVVNDDLYEDDRSFVDLIKSSYLFPENRNKKGFGNPYYTDFEKILQVILRDSKENQISILISDLIYSPKGRVNKPKDVLRMELKNLMREIYRRYSKTHSILILKAMSDYKGEYFNTLGGRKFIKTKRPYYTIIIGENASFDRLLNDKEYKAFMSFGNYFTGYENFAYLSKKDVAKQDRYYSILRDYNKIGNFRKKRSSELQNITEIQNIQYNDGDPSTFQFAIAMDFSDILVNSEYLLKRENYTINSPTPFIVQSIEKVEKTISNYNNDAQLISSATHIITLKTNKPIVQETQQLEICLRRVFPNWINESSTNKDIDPKEGKTFGLKDFIGGIYEAYYPVKEDEVYTKFIINLNK